MKTYKLINNDNLLMLNGLYRVYINFPCHLYISNISITSKVFGRCCNSVSNCSCTCN